MAVYLDFKKAFDSDLHSTDFDAIHHGHSVLNTVDTYILSKHLNYCL